jgi:hypothetical protein
MWQKIRVPFLMLVVLQGLHSIEEFTFKFYDVFPPMVVLYRNHPQLARPAFLVFNLLLLVVGLICVWYWVWPGRRGARTIVWVWVGAESFNVVAHSTWAILNMGYNPGLATAVGFVPLLVYVSYQLRRVSSHAAT